MINNKYYTSRDVISVRQDIIDFIKKNSTQWTDFSESDIGMMFIEILAGVSDMLNFYLDKQAKETFLMSAKQKKNIRGIVETLNYKLPSIGSAKGIEKLTLHNPYGGEDEEFTFTVVIPKYTSIINEGNVPTPYVLMHEVVFNGCETINADIMQGEKHILTLKTSDLLGYIGKTYKFYIPNDKVPLDCIAIRQNNVYWECVDDAFLEIDGGMKFSVHSDENEKTYIMFTYDFEKHLPTDKDTDIEIMYLTSLGSNGVAQALSLVKFVDPVFYEGEDISDALFITNPDKTHSAYDSIDLNALKAKARKNLMTMGRLITIPDFKNYMDSKDYIFRTKIADWNTDGDLVDKAYQIKCWLVTNDRNPIEESRLLEIAKELKDRSCAMQRISCHNATYVNIGLKATIYVRGSGDFRETIRMQADSALRAYMTTLTEFGIMISAKKIKDLLKDLSSNIMNVILEWDIADVINKFGVKECKLPDGNDTSFIELSKTEFPIFTAVDVALKGSDYGVDEAY